MYAVSILQYWWKQIPIPDTEQLSIKNLFESPNEFLTSTTTHPIRQRQQDEIEEQEKMENIASQSTSSNPEINNGVGGDFEV